jgi:hypothetical protein
MNNYSLREDHNKQIFITISINNKIIDINKVALKTLGCPERKHLINKSISKILKKNTIFSTNLECQTKNKINFYTTTIINKTSSGKISGVNIIAQPKHLAPELPSTEKHFKKILENIHLINTIFNTREDILFANNLQLS